MVIFLMYYNDILDFDFMTYFGSKFFSKDIYNAKIKGGGQIEVFNILNGYENIDPNIFLEIKESKITRGHNFTPVKKQSRLDVRNYSFSQRTINVQCLE